MKVMPSNTTVNYPFTVSSMSQQYLKTQFLPLNRKRTTTPSQD